ncbi:MAG: prepilin-type N-terminal cleavage/methylation domain-containing protein [Chloroflexi bacterium]|nr:prepilin-type N-terminal cleavage/methylation domain-containing protein [Chloroflexota bacterium]
MRRQLGFTLLELVVSMAIMGLFSAILVGVFFQFTRITGEMTADQSTLAELRNTTNWLFEDGVRAQKFATSTEPNLVTFEWMDATLYPPEFTSSAYTYDATTTTAFRNLTINSDVMAPQTLAGHIAQFGDISFSGSGSYLTSSATSTSEVSIDTTANGTNLNVQSRAPLSSAPPAGEYAIFLTGSGPPEMDWGGSGSGVVGNIYVNGEFRVTGSDNLVAGRVDSTDLITVTGSNNHFNSQNSDASWTSLPVSFTEDQFLPYTFSYSGDADLASKSEVWLDPDKKILKSGVYYATGRIKITGSNITGNVTFVALEIEISGNDVSLTAFDNSNLLFLASSTSINAVIISGDDVRYTGVLYAPVGGIQISGAGLVGEGNVYARRLNWSGSDGLIYYSAPPVVALAAETTPTPTPTGSPTATPTPTATATNTPLPTSTPTPTPTVTNTPLPTSTPTPTPTPSVWVSLDDTPSKVKYGGALATDGTNIYALRGANKKTFWRYSVALDSWSSLSDTPENVKAGGTLVHADGYIYAFRGGSHDDFWRYSISSGNWETLEDAPNNVGWGGSLTWDGSDAIYAFRGNRRDDFWKYSISADSWSSLSDAPSNVYDGGAVEYLSGLIYAFRGDDKDDFWKYTVSTDTWSSLQDTPKVVEEGGSLAWNGGDLIYALDGDKTVGFWVYSISGGNWLTLADTPSKVDDGGALIYLNGEIYALRGDDKDDFWKFTWP